MIPPTKHIDCDLGSHLEIKKTRLIYCCQKRMFLLVTCGSSNVVCAIHCIRCGLMYVGETGRSLRSRINGHRAGIIKDGQSLLYEHFRLSGHSAADMKVQILEKIYHSSENPVNIRLHRRLRELH